MSGFPSDSESSSQTFLWEAALLRAFLGWALIAATVSSAVSASCSGSSPSGTRLVPMADAFNYGILGRGESLVPLAVVRAKLALVLCPSHPHLRQSASFSGILLALPLEPP